MVELNDIGGGITYTFYHNMISTGGHKMGSYEYLLLMVFLLIAFICLCVTVDSIITTFKDKATERTMAANGYEQVECIGSSQLKWVKK